MNSGGGQTVRTGWGCLRRPWTVIYGSVVEVLMDWAYGAYPSQVWSPIPRMDMLHGSLSEQHNTSSERLTAFWMYINTGPGVSLCWRMNRPLVTYFTNRHINIAQRESRDQDRGERLRTVCVCMGETHAVCVWEQCVFPFYYTNRRSNSDTMINSATFKLSLNTAHRCPRLNKY